MARSSFVKTEVTLYNTAYCILQTCALQTCAQKGKKKDGYMINEVRGHFHWSLSFDAQRGIFTKSPPFQREGIYYPHGRLNFHCKSVNIHSCDKCQQKIFFTQMAPHSRRSPDMSVSLFLLAALFTASHAIISQPLSCSNSNKV